MASMQSTKKLAYQLANIAREISVTHGDYVAQTITYGLFINKWEPQIDLSSFINDSIDSYFIEQIENKLNINLKETFTDYFIQGKDPAIYFYEEFLRAYDCESSRTRGVHYSPPAVVSYITRAIASIVKDIFDESTEDAIFFDPCCGTGAFLNCIENSSRKIGTEIMPVPHKFASHLLPGCEILLANSLDEIYLNTNGKLLVILGNPPYSGHSANFGKVKDLLCDYRSNLTERNPKWLQDDYVKFIRMAEHRIVSTGRGIIAFITNHSYLFNPTFRAMRSHLMHNFDQIYVLNLHGNAKQVEKTPNGKQDENIFPIQMGVCITFMVKTSNQPDCRIRYAALQGTREYKLAALSKTDFNTTPWTDINPSASMFLFTPQDTNLQEEYNSFYSLFDIFEQHSVGFVTSRDAFAVDFDKNALLNRITLLRDGNINAEKLRSEFPVGDLDIDNARHALQNDPDWQEKALQVLYRPFDNRWVYYSKAIMERPRLPFMENLMNDNIALAIGRNSMATGSKIWDVVFCTDKPTDLNIFRRGGASLFPRWIYENGSRRTNIKLQCSDQDKLFYYIYALLHSNIYRQRYSDMLIIDYPRIPLASARDLLDSLAALGSELINIHLMWDNLADQYDSGISDSFHIGGYEIPHKYIHDRKHRALTDLEIKRLTRIKSAIAKTSGIQKIIDNLIQDNPPWNILQRELS